jgi:carbonic anhydrase
LEVELHRELLHKIIINRVNIITNRSSWEFDLTVVQIQHIVVAGHSGCGGINALFARDDFTTYAKNPFSQSLH